MKSVRYALFAILVLFAAGGVETRSNPDCDEGFTYCMTPVYPSVGYDAGIYSSVQDMLEQSGFLEQVCDGYFGHGQWYEGSYTAKFNRRARSRATM